ncbi:MAG: glycoside hydrolase family 31 protein [Bacteroidia bacterium]|nr:glycoside hydrolase family 31 protein [Bacteroidia bacterium]
MSYNTVEFAPLENHPGHLVHYTWQDNILECVGDNDASVRIYVIDDAIMRVRYSTEGYFERDFSYAIDSNFSGNITDLHLEDFTDHLVIKTPKVHCRVSKERLTLKFTDPSGKIISQDEKGFHWEKNETYGGEIVKMSRVLQTAEAFYGLGDKPMNLNLRGKRVVNWGTDEYGYHRDTDPIYKNIPVFYGVHHGMSYGIFFDNTFKSYFDFASERQTVSSFWANGGEMNYYFFAGPDMLDVCTNYTLLTGTPEMPPLWALGYQQCKWSYYPESQVREICNKLREYEIPCDAIYLDIDYMDGFRCFTWDLEKFPDPKGMVADLKAQGFKTMVIIDPGIKKDKDYWVYKEGLKGNHFCRRADGPFVNGKVWPGECYFPDFTNPEVREWWATLYEELIGNIGVAGVWNDMNEPALFEVPSKTFPLDVRHNFDGEPCSHRKAHNIYGMQMARATYEGVKRFAGNNRSLVITRSGYSGLQRYSSVWTGDNLATWEHLALANIQVQRLSACGISFCGSDVGGFIDQPSGELFVRWVQLAAFHPFFRTHSSGDHGDQEPWSFGEENMLLAKKFIDLRYELLLYMYTTFYQYSQYGIPMVKSLIMLDTPDDEVKNRMDEFIIGDHILICPMLQHGITERHLYIPRGNWFDYWTDELLTGKHEYRVKANIDSMPIYIQAGAVIPKIPVMQFVGEKEISQIQLHIYHVNGKQESSLFLDDLDGYDYQKGQFELSKFIVEGNPDKLIIEQTKEGQFKSGHNYLIHLHGCPFTMGKIFLDGQEIQYNTSIEVDASFQKIEVFRR